MAIDLGNAPVDTPPTWNQRKLIRSGINSNETLIDILEGEFAEDAPECSDGAFDGTIADYPWPMDSGAVIARSDEDHFFGHDGHHIFINSGVKGIIINDTDFHNNIPSFNKFDSLEALQFNNCTMQYFRINENENIANLLIINDYGHYNYLPDIAGCKNLGNLVLQFANQTFTSGDFDYVIYCLDQNGVTNGVLNVATSDGVVPDDTTASYLSLLSKEWEFYFTTF
jgi:hypothetical protein